jgi:hypothetical protein
MNAATRTATLEEANFLARLLPSRERKKVRGELEADR